MAGNSPHTGDVTLLSSEDRVPVVQARGISHRFAGHLALSDVSLDINAGEIFGLLGPDGAGKTTLLQIFSGILDPTEGECSVLGYDTCRDDIEVNSRVGYMSQGFSLYERLTVDENLRFAARIRGVKGKIYADRSTRLLGMAGLQDFRNRRAENLSGGMRKKLSLSCSLVHHPMLLLLDELSLGVDPLSRRELWEMLRTFRDEGVAVVISTPYMGEAENCDRLCFLEKGLLLAVDTPTKLTARAAGTVIEIRSSQLEESIRSIRANPNVMDIRFRDDAARVCMREVKFAERELATLASAGIAADAVNATLEETFLHLSASNPEFTMETSNPRINLPAAPEAPSTNLAVEMTDVTCKFGDFVALDGVDLSLKGGDIFGFLGPNGAGKTTLIRILCGMLKPTRGHATVAGVDVLRQPRKLSARIGYMSQHFSLYPDLTCAENLSFFGGVYGLRGSRKRRLIRQATDYLGLETNLNRIVSTLSGAVRQRVALACSILHKPTVLFLDEPTSGVDPYARSRFWQLIKDQANAGMTVFVTTHYLDEAANCDRIGLLSAGRLLAEGTLPVLRAGIQADDSASMEDVFMEYIRRSTNEVETVL